MNTIKPSYRHDNPLRELDILRAENERLKTTLCKYQHIASPEDRKVTRLITEIGKLKAELAEAKKDAERYRWLRSHNSNDVCDQCGYDGLRLRTGHLLDCHIDAAMKGK